MKNIEMWKNRGIFGIMTLNVINIGNFSLYLRLLIFLLLIFKTGWSILLYYVLGRQQVELAASFHCSSFVQSVWSWGTGVCGAVWSVLTLKVIWIARVKNMRFGLVWLDFRNKIESSQTNAVLFGLVDLIVYKKIIESYILYKWQHSFVFSHSYITI